MSMQLGGSGGVKSDINVTPLVDVMLVLLIIMMIVAPLLQQGVAVKLPIATNTSEKPETQEQTVLAITAESGCSSTACRCPKQDLRGGSSRCSRRRKRRSSSSRPTWTSSTAP